MDKLEHAVGFGVPVLLLAVCLAWRGRATGRPAAPRTSLVVGAAFAVHAVVSELIQARFYAERTGDPYDVLADLVGVVLGLLGARALVQDPVTADGVR